MPYDTDILENWKSASLVCGTRMDGTHVFQTHVDHFSRRSKHRNNSYKICRNLPTYQLLLCLFSFQFTHKFSLTFNFFQNGTPLRISFRHLVYRGALCWNQRWMYSICFFNLVRSSHLRFVEHKCQHKCHQRCRTNASLTVFSLWDKWNIFQRRREVESSLDLHMNYCQVQPRRGEVLLFWKSFHRCYLVFALSSQSICWHFWRVNSLRKSWQQNIAHLRRQR